MVPNYDELLSTKVGLLHSSKKVFAGEDRL